MRERREGPILTQRFGAAAEQVRRRWALARVCVLLARTGPVLFAAAAAWLVAQRLQGVPAAGAAWACALVAAWLAALGAWAWLRRPSPAAALALWDERAGRQEMFLSAYVFERAATDPGFGERLHLARAGTRLDRDTPGLGRDLPLRVAPSAWAPPAIFLALAGSAWLVHPLAAEDLPLTDDARERAREVARELAEEPRGLEQLEGLTPEEEKKTRELRESVAQGAEKLRKLEDATPREVLEQLEQLARQAEGLADGLGEDGADPLSAGMLAELERHADTADLAGALRSRDPEKIADEAEKLARKLDRDDLSIEERERIEDALGRALQAGNDRDRKSPVGKKLAEAHQELQGNRPKQAAQKFAELAKEFRRAQERRNALRQLQQLARSLRQAGLKVLQRSRRELQRLARTPPSGQSQPGRSYAQPMTLLPGGKPSAGARSSLVPKPGATPSPCAQPGQGTPVPGAGQGQPGQSSPIPGSGQGQGAPAPGTGSGAGPGGGAAPVPGSGAGTGPGSTAGAPGAGAGTGGLQAGNGPAAMGNRPTGAIAPKGTEVVQADPSATGESQVRAVAGPEHEEEAAREAQRIRIEAIRAEEEALHAEPLPLSRREQVLRYFTELRRQLERGD